MTVNLKPNTLGALREQGYQVIPVREEIRNNLISKIRSEEVVFAGIIGFEDTVIPQTKKWFM